MRLRSLRIAAFKNLHDVEVTFDPASDISVVVGQNGTGKSNLLEALVKIFRDLDVDPGRPSLEYELSYRRGEHEVVVNAHPERNRNRLAAEVDGRPVTMREFGERRHELLPGFVFGYYSGPGNRFEEHFEHHQNRYYERLLAKEEDVPLRRFFFARPSHSQFVLLAFALDPDAAVQQFLSQLLGIEGIEAVNVVLTQPGWAKPGTRDPFWGASGTPRPLMERLFAASFAPLREKRRVKVDFRRTVGRDHVWLHLDLDRLRPVYQAYSSRQEFFKALESLVISDLLLDFSIVVRVRGIDGGLEYRELSEGEQQLLAVLGLLRFTQEEHSLMLLDEPDTHLNPAWSIEYTRLLHDIMGASSTSQVVLATHDPLIVAGLTREQVVLLERGEGRSVSARHPDRDPRGMGVAALLTSEVYGLRSQLDLETLQLLDEKRHLAAKEPKSDRDRTRLAELETVTDEVDLAATIRDPFYKTFVEAMQDREEAEGLDTPVLSAEEMERRQVLALEILESLDPTSDEGQT